tara:strand:- start:916 stop:1326 length:411 start_codon:yes stop_codon:yes gene_type:complete
MKHLKSFATKILRTKKIPTPKLRLSDLARILQGENIPHFEIKLFFIVFLLVVPSISYGQLNELAQELQQGESDIKRIADIIIRAVKTIAGVSIIIGGLVFLYLRDQQSDLSKKVGQVIIGIAIFWILLAVGDSMRS